MACCRLAAKGRSLADSSYESEKKTILDFLNLQRPAEQPVLNPNSLDIQVEDYIAPKYLKKSKGKVNIFFLHRFIILCALFRKQYAVFVYLVYSLWVVISLLRPVFRSGLPLGHVIFKHLLPLKYPYLIAFSRWQIATHTQTSHIFMDGYPR